MHSAARSTRSRALDAHRHAAELHPNLDHSAICRLLIRAEQNGGLDLHQLTQEAVSA
jgi:hypothetical protein